MFFHLTTPASSNIPLLPAVSICPLRRYPRPTLWLVTLSCLIALSGCGGGGGGSVAELPKEDLAIGFRRCELGKLFRSNILPTSISVRTVWISKAPPRTIQATAMPTSIFPFISFLVQAWYSTNLLFWKESSCDSQLGRIRPYILIWLWYHSDIGIFTFASLERPIDKTILF